tara:strand:+ start:240 stop:1151 length:912 start_codon:yes stop_codon:yes gene_type:complete
MVYTHYAYLEPRKITDIEWMALKNEILALTVAEEWEDSGVVLEDDIIQVKGSYEWFSIPRDCSYEAGDKYFTFTKTNRRDYDYIIVACYMALRRCVNGVVLRSDGGWEELEMGRSHYAMTILNGMGLTLDEEFADTIHDPTPSWYIGDPCYALDDIYYSEMLDKMSGRSINDNGLDVSLTNGHITVYNSGLGGDGEVKIADYSLCVDSGLLCVMSANMVRPDPDDGGEIIRAKFRPVFETNADHFPPVMLTIDKDVYTMTEGYTECDYCDEYHSDASMDVDGMGYMTCGCEYNENEEVIEDED